jgi:hypothetical protein
LIEELEPRLEVEMYSEDFAHERHYGTVRILNPFVDLGVS